MGGQPDNKMKDIKRNRPPRKDEIGYLSLKSDKKYKVFIKGKGEKDVHFSVSDEVKPSAITDAIMVGRIEKTPESEQQALDNYDKKAKAYNKKVIERQRKNNNKEKQQSAKKGKKGPFGIVGMQPKNVNFKF
tara:strand:- start:67 stop:462 length:396 start_codon:yes stop_codon:yes gene_type:complete